MKRATKPNARQLATLDAMLADPVGRPRAQPPESLHARTIDALHREAARSTARTGARPAVLWRIGAGVAGVAAVAAAWMFAIQVFEARTAAPAPDAPGVRPASLAAVATLDERLLNESKAAAARIVSAVNATYRHEFDALREDARRAAERAGTYTRWIAPGRDSDLEPAAPES